MSRCLRRLSLPALMFLAAPLVVAQQPQEPYLMRLPPPEGTGYQAAAAAQPGQRVAIPPVATQPPPPAPAPHRAAPPPPVPAFQAPPTAPNYNYQPQPVTAFKAPAANAPAANPAPAPAVYRQPQPAQGYATPAAHNLNTLQQHRVAYANRQEEMPPPQPVGPPMPPPEVVPVPVPQRSQSYFTLDQLTQIAERQNPILERSDAEIEMAMGERVQAALYPNPRFETNNPEIWAGQNSFVNFGFQQDLVTKGKIRLDKAAADQLVRSETAGYNVDRAQMLTEVRSQYVQALAMKQRVLLAQYLVKVSGQSVNVARQLQKAGEGSLTDVLLLDSEYQRSLAELDNARTLLDGEYKQLAAVTGVPDLYITELEGSLFHIAPEFNEQAIRQFVANNSALMERMQAEIIRSQVQLRRAEAEAYPNIRFGPAFQSGTMSGQSQFWLSVVFDIPVWDLNQGNIRKAQGKVRSTHADLEVMRNEMLKQTAEKFARYNAAKQVAARIQNSILPNSQNALSLVQDGFSKGQFDVNRVLQAQRVLSDVAREHIEASEKAWTGAAELGGLIQLEYFPMSPPNPR